MKLTRKLIPAMLMLLVSAVLMSTASFAWFAMNKDVTATGMEVKAVADSIFLEIKGAADDGWSTEANALEVDDEGNVVTPVALYPVAHENEFADDDAVNNKANWYYKYVTNPGDHDEGAGSPQEPATLGDYVYKTTFTVRLNDKLVQSATKLRVASITLPENTGISAVITCGDTVLEDFKASNDAVTEEKGLLAATMNAAEVEINVYIYIDGNNENVYSNNVATLAGEIEIAFTVSP